MIYATWGALAVGLAALLYEVLMWWPGVKPLRKRPREAVVALVPFLFSFAYGALAVLGVGGLVGMASDWVLWGAGWLGDAAFVWGVGGTRESVTGGASMALTNGGLLVVLLMTVVLIVLRKKKEHLRKTTRNGALAGVCLGAVKTIALLLVIPLGSAVNAAGEVFTAWH